MKDAEKEIPEKPDLEADYWTISEVAGFLGVQINTVRVYNARSVANQRNGTPKAGDLPRPDRVFGRSPAWRPATITVWNERDRPGMGVGGGRPRDR
ncbi:hypothetical protein [Streptosporangium sp. NPDC051022]|uniref:hypothetical protein n=1 Tax=Streptosporangium sp. NPDC051022 TaxID=3155752 RepID=UPI00341F24F9